MAATEGQRHLDLVRSLASDDWDRPTNCARWTVRDVAAHRLGAAEGVASTSRTPRRVSPHHGHYSCRDRAHSRAPQGCSYTGDPPVPGQDHPTTGRCRMEPA
ncbi:MAG: maleylpyruvate isomerase N-terminal domain-containing protein [Actinobacteria bacterium]|nr:maleylpyruvate isomerase N-terminal domain-containing protein [Actinomycetota bacterium]